LNNADQLDDQVVREVPAPSRMCVERMFRSIPTEKLARRGGKTKGISAYFYAMKGVAHMRLDNTTFAV
jgi:hypothetical protein